MKVKQISVSVVTLGCPRNEVESDYARACLEDSGFEIVSDAAQADVIVVNTCGFIEPARQESIDTILELSELKKNDKLRTLILAGCLGQRYPQELFSSLPEVDAVVGIAMWDKLEEIIGEALSGKRLISVDCPPKTFKNKRRYIVGAPSAYLQIADGCDRVCSYCAIPLIRGRYRSRPIEHLLAEAESLISAGCKEINLVAQDITRYGLDLYGKKYLPEFLEKLASLGPEWIRLLYLEPDGVTEDIIEAVAVEEKVCKYLDIPFQHASEHILKAMKRWGRKENYLNLIRALREKLPEVALRTSLIVGFPGESEEDFEELVEFVQEAKFDYLGVFQFSPEEGTDASTFSQRVDSLIKEERYHQVLAVQERIREEKNKRIIGRKLEVLIEDINRDPEYRLLGRSKYQAPEVDGEIYIKGNGKPGGIAKVKIQKAEIYDFFGEIVE